MGIKKVFWQKNGNFEKEIKKFGKFLDFFWKFY